MATNNGYSGTLVPRIGYTRSVRFRNRVRRSFGQSGAVLGVFLYLIFTVPGNGYLTTGYTRSWLYPYEKHSIIRTACQLLSWYECVSVYSVIILLVSICAFQEIYSRKIQTKVKKFVMVPTLPSPSLFSNHLVNAWQAQIEISNMYRLIKATCVTPSVNIF